MPRKARVENGVVVELLDATPFPPFHPSLTWITAADLSIVEGWLWDGASFSAPPEKPLADVKVEAKIKIGWLCEKQITITAGWTIDRQLRAQRGEYGDPNAAQLAADYSQAMNMQCDIYKANIDAAVDVAAVDAIVAGVAWDVTSLTTYWGLL